MALGKGQFRDIVDIVETQQTTENWNNGLFYAYLSGVCLAIVSRLTQVLSDGYLIHHEVFMSFYACLTTCTFVLGLLVPFPQEKHDNFLAFKSH